MPFDNFSFNARARAAGSLRTEEEKTSRNSKLGYLRTAERGVVITWKQQLKKAVKSFFDLLTYPAGTGPNTSMCKYYGHIVPNTWAGQYPNCMDCKIQVTSAAQLRKAVPNPNLGAAPN